LRIRRIIGDGPQVLYLSFFRFVGNCGLSTLVVETRLKPEEMSGAIFG
jgi:hypothetical protein